MNDLANAAVILNALLMICMIVGGYMAIRSGKSNQAGEIQAKAIEALKAELESVQRKLDVLQRENAQLHATINLIKRAIRQKGFTVSIDGDMVTIENQNSSSVSRIEETRRRMGDRFFSDETIAEMPRLE